MLSVGGFFQRFVLGMLRCVWCVGSLEPEPDAFPQFDAILHSVFQFQLELGLLRSRRVTRPVRAAGGFRLHARFRLSLSATATEDHSLQDLLDSCATSGASVFCWRHPPRAAGNASSPQ